MVTWIPSIYPSHVSIYTSTMDPSWVIVTPMLNSVYRCLQNACSVIRNPLIWCLAVRLHKRCALGRRSFTVRPASSMIFPLNLHNHLSWKYSWTEVYSWENHRTEWWIFDCHVWLPEGISFFYRKLIGVCFLCLKINSAKVWRGEHSSR